MKRAKRSQEEIDAANREFQENQRKLVKETTERTIATFKKLGLKEFEWLCPTEMECDTCQSNNGRIFYLDRPPNGVLPGQCPTCPDGICSCKMIPVVKS